MTSCSAGSGRRWIERIIHWIFSVAPLQGPGWNSYHVSIDGGTNSNFKCFFSSHINGTLPEKSKGIGGGLRSNLIDRGDNYRRCTSRDSTCSICLE